MADDDTREENVADIDFSQIRTSIQLGGRIIEQILNGIHYGSPEVRLLLLDECDMILECRVCRGLFRALANFVAHKRIYCNKAYITTQQDLFDNLTEDEVVVVEPTAPEDDAGDVQVSEPESKSAEERVQETISQINEGILGKSQMYQLYSKAVEKVDRQKKAKKTLSAVLSKIASNPNAVRVSYQEVDEETLSKMEVQMSKSAPKPVAAPASGEEAEPSPREVVPMAELETTPAMDSGETKTKTNPCLEKMLCKTAPGAKSVVSHSANVDAILLREGKKTQVKDFGEKKINPSSTAVMTSSSPVKTLIDSSKGSPNSPSKATPNTSAIVPQTSARGITIMEKARPTEKSIDSNLDEIEKYLSDSIVNLPLLTCLQCNTKYSSRKTLLYHAQMRHSGLRTFFPCPYCVNVFFYFWGLTRHLQHHHKKSPHQINKMRKVLRDAAFTKSVTKQCVQAKDQLEYTTEVEPLSEDGSSPEKAHPEVDTLETTASGSCADMTTPVFRSRSGRLVSAPIAMGKAASPPVSIQQQSPGDKTPIHRPQVTPCAVPREEPGSMEVASEDNEGLQEIQKPLSQTLGDNEEADTASLSEPSEQVSSSKHLIRTASARKINKAMVKHTSTTIKHTFASRYVPPAEEDLDVSSKSEDGTPLKESTTKQKFAHQLTCEKCEKVFWKKERLANHKKYCSASKTPMPAIKHVCSLCSKAFQKHNHLNYHFVYCKRRHDMEEKTIVLSCPNCDKTFEKRVGLDNHKRCCRKYVGDKDGEFKKPPVTDVVKAEESITNTESQREVTAGNMRAEHTLTRSRTRTSSDNSVEQLRFRQRTGRNSSGGSGSEHRRPRRKAELHTASGESDVEEMDMTSLDSSPNFEDDEDIHVVEEIWVHKQPGRPSERVKSNRIYVMEADSAGRLHCQDTKKLSAIVDETNLKCMKCGQDFTSVSNLRRHAIRHLGWKRYKCKLCRFSSYNKSECNTHIVRTHSEKYRFTSAESLIVDLNKEASRIRSKRKQNTMCEKQAAVEQTRPEHSAEAPQAKKRRQVTEKESLPAGNDDDDDGDTDPSRKFNISTRNSPRKFDTRPYRRLDKLSTLVTRKGYYPKSNVNVKGSSEGEGSSISDVKTQSQKKLDLNEEVVSIRESRSLCKETDSGNQQDGRRSCSADSSKPVENVSCSTSLCKRSQMNKLEGSTSDLSDVGSTEGSESDYGRGKRKPKLSALMTLIRDAKESDKGKNTVAKTMGKGKTLVLNISKCEPAVRKPAENAPTFENIAEKTSGEAKHPQKKNAEPDKPPGKKTPDDAATAEDTAPVKESSDKEDSPSQKTKHSSGGDSRSPEFLAPWPRAPEPMSVQEMFELIRTSSSTGGSGRRKSTGDSAGAESCGAKKTTGRLSTGSAKSAGPVSSGDGKAKLGATLTRRSGAAVSLSLRTSRPGVDWSQASEEVQDNGGQGLCAEGQDVEEAVKDLKPRLRSDSSAASLSQVSTSGPDVKPRLRSDGGTSVLAEVVKSEIGKHS